MNEEKLTDHPIHSENCSTNCANLSKIMNSRGYVMVNGTITIEGTGDELLASQEIRASYLEGGR